MSHLALMKMLYILDREALLKWDRPVSGGKYASLEHGPIISPVLNLMRKLEGFDEPTYWTDHLTKEGHEMHLKVAPGDDDLSNAELSLIDDIYDRYGKLTKWQIRDLTHDFEEWSDPGKSSYPISVPDVLHATGKRGEQISRVLRDMNGLAKVDAILQG